MDFADPVRVAPQRVLENSHERLLDPRPRPFPADHLLEQPGQGSPMIAIGGLAARIVERINCAAIVSHDLLEIGHHDPQDSEDVGMVDDIEGSIRKRQFVSEIMDDEVRIRRLQPVPPGIGDPTHTTKCGRQHRVSTQPPEP
jgi:hypothetical protein